MSAKTAEMRCSFSGRLHTDVAKLIAGPGIYIFDGCVNLCVDILAEATKAEPLSLPEWVPLADDELLQRIPFVAASVANVDAELRDRVHELRYRGVSWERFSSATT